jgi:hypothetical protein
MPTLPKAGRSNISPFLFATTAFMKLVVLLILPISLQETFK